MSRATIVFASLLVVASCQQPQPLSVDPSPGQTGPAGFMPMKDERHAPEATLETSSVQSRDYSGGSDFYGYNYPASYGPPSSSYGSQGIYGIGRNQYITVLWRKKPNVPWE